MTTAELSNFRTTQERTIPTQVERLLKQCLVDRLYGKVILDFKDGEILTGRIERSIHFK